MRAHGATSFPDPESNGAITIPHAMESSPAYLAALHFCLHKYGVPPPPAPREGVGHEQPPRLREPRLAVVPGDLANAGDGWPVAEGAVAASLVVVVDPV